jgi:hypothetical protein
MDPGLSVKTKESQRCEEGDGLPSCIFRINKSEWIKYGKFLSKHKKEASIERDYTSGAHGCIIQYLYNSAIILEENPGSCIINFVNKVEDLSYINMVKELIKEIDEEEEKEGEEGKEEKDKDQELEKAKDIADYYKRLATKLSSVMSDSLHAGEVAYDIKKKLGKKPAESSDDEDE